MVSVRSNSLTIFKADAIGVDHYTTKVLLTSTSVTNRFVHANNGLLALQLQPGFGGIDGKRGGLGQASGHPAKDERLDVPE